VTTLCELASKLPALVGASLDREAKLKRGRFREETLTDIFTGALAAFAGPSLVIEYPVETETGGDIDLDFWNVSRRRRLRLRIQAKRLNAETSSGKAVAMENRAYRELLHRPSKKAPYQFRTLVGIPRAYLPLYMFYNHGSVARDPYFAGLFPAVRGINIAFADDVAKELETKLAAELEAEPKRLHHKRLTHLRPHFFDLATILCAPVKAGDDVPSPEAVAKELAAVCDRSTVTKAPRPIGDHIKRSADIRVALKKAFGGTRVINAGPSIRINSELERPTLTFVSGRNADNPGPMIWNEAYVG
jgi:hypothetical protein